MDDSVIVIEQEIEVIDLSETICERTGEIDCHEPKDTATAKSLEIIDTVAENQHYTKKKCDVEPVEIIDLTNESEIEISRLDSSKSATLSRRSWDLSCPICFEKFFEVREVKITKCGHVFCRSCIEKAVRKTRKCPMCRKYVLLGQLISVNSLF